jgi:hypothetical protein
MIIIFISVTIEFGECELFYMNIIQLQQKSELKIVILFDNLISIIQL